MMKDIGNKIRDKYVLLTSKQAIITLFILAHIVLIMMMVYAFPQINAKFGTEAFDLKTFGYSVPEAMSMLHNLDSPTVSFYLFPQLFLLDILYPLLLALFLSTLIYRLAHLTNVNLNRVSPILYFIPFMAMLCDYFENGMIAIMITNPTDVPLGIIKVSSILTQLKSVFTTISWIVILILFFVWLRKKWNFRKIQGK